MHESFWIGFPCLFGLCAYLSFKKGTIFGAESCLQSLENDNIITIDDEGRIEPVCSTEEE